MKKKIIQAIDYVNSARYKKIMAERKNKNKVVEIGKEDNNVKAETKETKTFDSTEIAKKRNEVLAKKEKEAVKNRVGDNK